MKRRTVFLLAGAERDIDDIYRHIAESTGPATAEKIRAGLEENCLSLENFADRGNVPKELRLLGDSPFRELHYKPYRIFYRVEAARVIVYCILDGRRDLPALLQSRLLR